MFSKKAVTAAVVATLMGGTSVASAAPAGKAVFASGQDNTVVSMTKAEMTNTQGELVCGGACTVGLAAGSAFGVGFLTGLGMYAELN